LPINPIFSHPHRLLLGLGFSCERAFLACQNGRIKADSNWWVDGNPGSPAASIFGVRGGTDDVILFVKFAKHGNSPFIHHSIIHAEEDSNWSSGLTLWDFLHRTLKLNVPQSEITIGVPAYRNESEVQLTEVLGMPFRKQRPTWQLPQNGEPSRAPIAGSPPEKLLA
jgi:hypothetical protein